MEQQNNEFSPIDFEAEQQPEQQPAAQEVKKPKKKKGMSWLLGIIAGVAVVALAVLCVSIFAPDWFNRVFKSTPLTRADETVMTIGGYPISVMEYNHYLYPVRMEYEGDDPTYWKTHLEEGENIKNQALEMFRDNCAMLQWAKDVGIELTDEEREEVRQTIEQVKSSYETEADFYAALEENYLTVELYQKIYEDSMIYNKLYEYVFTQSDMKEVTDEELAAYAEENGYLGAKHILFATTGDETADAEKLALAEDVLAQLQAGADFDTLMMEYTEDPGITYYPSGYTFTDGEMVAEFEQAVKELGVGEMSGIVQSPNGYHIILRVAPDTTTMTDGVIQQRAAAKIDEYREAMQVEYGRGYDLITLDQTFWNYPAAADEAPAQEDAAQNGSSETQETEEQTQDAA